MPATWRDGFGVLRSPALPSILALGLVLFVIFGVWIESAQLLYVRLYGSHPPDDAIAFLRDVLTTGRGWSLTVVGGLIGFIFAALALSISVVSFPSCSTVTLDFFQPLTRRFDFSANPVAIAFWGLIVAALLVLGSLPLFIGLAVVMPTLGHATWRLYRRAIECGRGG